MINYTTVLALMISNIKINDGSKKMHASHLFISLYPPLVYLIYRQVNQY